MFNSEYCYHPFSKYFSFIVGGVGYGGFVIVCNTIQNKKMIYIIMSIVERRSKSSMLYGVMFGPTLLLGQVNSILSLVLCC